MQLTSLKVSFGLVILIAGAALLINTPSNVEATFSINIWKYRYPFYGGYGGYYPLYGGYGGYGYGSIGLGGGGYGYGR